VTPRRGSHNRASLCRIQQSGVLRNNGFIGHGQRGVGATGSGIFKQQGKKFQKINARPGRRWSYIGLHRAGAPPTVYLHQQGAFRLRDALNLLGRLRRRSLRGLRDPPVRDAEGRIEMDGSTSEGGRHATGDQASPWERTQEPDWWVTGRRGIRAWIL
jgi:hypothetical protein